MSEPTPDVYPGGQTVDPDEQGYRVDSVPASDLLVMRHDGTGWSTLAEVAEERAREAAVPEGTEVPNDALPSGWPWPQG